MAFSLFRKSGAGDQPRNADIRIDPFRGAPEAARWKAALKAGDWQGVAHEVAALRDPARREVVLDALVGEVAATPALDAWADSGSADGLLVRGAQRIRWAWEARGSGDAETVGEDMWPVFFERLRLAEADLRAAARLAPDDHVPWIQLVLSARALQIPKDEMWARFRRAMELEPFSPYACDQMLQGLCDKWSGSHDEMFDFAVSTSQAAPPGHPVHRVVAAAVVERSIADDVDDWRKLREATPMLRQILYDAAARSVDLPDFGAWPDIDQQRLITRNVFAAAFAQMEHIERMRAEFERIGADATEWPWQMWDGLTRVRRLRKLAGLR